MGNYLIVENASLTQYNTLRIKSKAQLLVFPLNNEAIKDIVNDYKNRKIIFLGNGSNILFSKSYYNDEYVFVSFKHMDDIYFNNNLIHAQAGVTLSKLSWFALELGVQGYEFLEDIPGSIGGAVVMNAGTYQNMIGQLISTVTFYSKEKDEIRTDSVKEKDFGRRYSTWAARGDIILSATFDFEEKERLSYYEPILDELLENKKRRYMKQPRNYPNAGSVFKRPQKNGKDHYVWQLFEGCDLRGHRLGGATISDKHPGFIVNVHDADPEDILGLINLAQMKVREKYEIDLELEWDIV